MGRKDSLPHLGGKLMIGPELSIPQIKSVFLQKHYSKVGLASFLG